MRNFNRQSHCDMQSVNKYRKIKISAIVILLLLTILSAGRFVWAASPATLDLYRPSNGTFYSQSTEISSFTAIRWGVVSDVLVPGDYDGDGITDAAVWRPETGCWYILQSSDAKPLYVRWGTTTMHPTGGLPDVPAPADFDGDGRTDIAVWRPDTGVWYVLNSSKSFDPAKASVFQWGKLGDVPVQSDYDGDGKADFAVFRTLGNTWYIFESAAQRWKTTTFGLAGTDRLVPADYTGDRKADIAVYRSGTWYVLNSETGETEPFQFGFTDGVAAPGDYDGDGQTDFAVFRRGSWYIYDSESPRLHSVKFGSDGDIPLNSLHSKASIVAVP